MAGARNETPTLAERFPIETAYWEANSERLAEDFPNKLLVIQGQDVKKVFETAKELVEAETEDQEATVGLLCVTSREAVVHPYVQVTEGA